MAYEKNISTKQNEVMATGELLRKLEKAIAQGNHRLAAKLAHDLALSKVNENTTVSNQPFA